MTLNCEDGAVKQEKGTHTTPSTAFFLIRWGTQVSPIPPRPLFTRGDIFFIEQSSRANCGGCLTARVKRGHLL